MGAEYIALYFTLSNFGGNIRYLGGSIYRCNLGFLQQKQGYQTPEKLPMCENNRSLKGGSGRRDPPFFPFSYKWFQSISAPLYH